MPDFVTSQGIDWPVAVDAEERTTKAFAVDSFPDYYLIDRSGNLRFADLSNREVDRAVEVQLAEKVEATGVPAAPASSIRKRPDFIASAPLYGQFLFGDKDTKKHVWAVFDKRSPDAAAYEVLYLDLDADGDLTEPGERFEAKPSRSERRVFEVGRYRPPGSDEEHAGFTITWYPSRVMYRIKWRGDKIVRGGYGNTPDEYCGFSRDPRSAPVLVPGHDLPFRFEHWMSGTLKRGAENDFKVFIGNRGRGTGTFSCVDDRFLPPSEYVLATLIYEDPSGTSKEALFELKQRC